MIKYLLLFLIPFICLAEEPKRVVVIDTGLDIEDVRFKDKLCKDIPYVDYTGEGITDNHGHGTFVVGLIKKYAKDTNYCLTIVKYYRINDSSKQTVENMLLSFQLVWHLQPKLVNISSGGPEFNPNEFSYIRNSKFTLFITAAGNDSENLDEACNYYPACYKLRNVVRVGSLTSKHKIASSSNYGNIIQKWEIGENVTSTLPNNRTGVNSGTSFSAAIYTGKYINENF